MAELLQRERRKYKKKHFSDILQQFATLQPYSVAHLAYHVHKSGRKTSIIIITSLVQADIAAFCFKNNIFKLDDSSSLILNLYVVPIPVYVEASFDVYSYFS